MVTWFKEYFLDLGSYLTGTPWRRSQGRRHGYSWQPWVIKSRRQEHHPRSRDLQSLSLHRQKWMGKKSHCYINFTNVAKILSRRRRRKRRRRRRRRKKYGHVLLYHIKAKEVFLSNCVKIYWNILKNFSITWEFHWHHLMNYWVYVGMIWLNKIQC